MLVAGCGCPAVPSSSSSSTATALSALEGELTHQETTSGRLYTATPTVSPTISLNIILHIKSLQTLFVLFPPC